jgi:septum site-determining protein MinD
MTNVERVPGGQVIAFASAKGGTGKTVLSASTALALLRCGKRVLVIDGDFSTRGLSLFVLGNILYTPDMRVRDQECLAEYLLSGIRLEQIRPRQLERHDVEYHILFSNKSLWKHGVPEQANLSDTRLAPEHYIDSMNHLFKRFKTEYDYIIIDTRGGYDFTSAVPALLSDTYIIVLEPDRVSLEQISGYNNAMNKFSEDHNIRIPLRGFIINKASFDPTQTGFIEELTRTYEIKTYGVIPADLSCIRAYERTESPIVQSPQSDFSYWFIRAIEKFIAPRINWTDREDVKLFDELRRNIGREWGARKRTEKILSWLPFAQLIPIVGASVLYLVFRQWPTQFALLTTYAAVASFIVWSMFVSTLSGLQWLGWREVSVWKRRAVLAIAGFGILFASYLMIFDVPEHLLLLSLPPKALRVGRSAQLGVDVLQKLGVQVTNEWMRMALDTIAHSEDAIYSTVEQTVRRGRDLSPSDASPDSATRLISSRTRQIIDEAKQQVRVVGADALARINGEGEQTKSETEAVVSILEHPRKAFDVRVEIVGHNPSTEFRFPSVYDILSVANRTVLDAGNNPDGLRPPDVPRSPPR